MKQLCKYLAIGLLFCFFQISAQAEETDDEVVIPDPRLAVAAQEEGPRAAISGDVLSASYFLLFDAQGNLVKKLSNDSKGDLNAIADKLNKNDVTVLVARDFSTQIEAGLNQQDIIAVNKSGDVGSAVTALLQCEEPAIKKSAPGGQSDSTAPVE